VGCKEVLSVIKVLTTVTSGYFLLSPLLLCMLEECYRIRPSEVVGSLMVSWAAMSGIFITHSFTKIREDAEACAVYHDFKKELVFELQRIEEHLKIDINEVIPTCHNVMIRELDDFLLNPKLVKNRPFTINEYFELKEKVSNVKKMNEAIRTNESVIVNGRECQPHVENDLRELKKIIKSILYRMG